MHNYNVINKRHKFNAIQVITSNGIRFQSKLEYSYYKYLKILQSTGKVSFFLRQVPLHLEISDVNVTKYVIDFQVFWSDSTVTFVDVKGVETDMYILKKKMVEAAYPITITVIKKGDF